MHIADGKIESQRELAPGIFELRLRTEAIAAEAVPGQFVNLFCADASRLLPRPISICEAFPERGELRLVYRVAGRGTAEFSQLAPGDGIRVMGPLGNGFPVEACAGKNVLLVGGGIGIPPLLESAKALRKRDCLVRSVLGYRDRLFLWEDFSKISETELAVEDAGIACDLRERGLSITEGTVLDAIREKKIEADLIFSCGPKPMLRALQSYGEERKITTWLSLEERMACGVGACLACVCKTVGTDAHTGVHNRRICREGPVFNASEVIL